MDPESTLEELDTAFVAALKCLTFLGVIGTDVQGRIRRGEVGAAQLAEANQEYASDLLESWRALNAALKPHVMHDFTTASDSCVEIGEVIAAPANFAVWSVSHLALIMLAAALKPGGYWPSSQDPETDLLLPDFDEADVVDAPDSALAPWTFFDQLSLREIAKARAAVYREYVAARDRLRAAGGDETPAVKALKRDVAKLKRATKKKTKTEKFREQRNKFSRSRRPHKTWNEIYEAYREKYPDDDKASPDTLRLSFSRDPTDNRQ